jgi:hypothetical protein
LILGVASTVKDETFRRRLCYAALATHGIMAAWRVLKESTLPALAKDWKGQLVGDAIMASSWIYYLLQRK